MRHGEDVYESRDGFLFLTGGHHDVLDYMLGTQRPTTESIENFIQNQSKRAACSTEKGFRYAMWIFPDKLFALRNKVPELGSLESLYLSRYRSDPRCLDLDYVHYPAALFEGQTQFFTRGDTHYSPLGDIAMTEEILNRIEPGLGTQFRAAAKQRFNSRIKFKGDLSGKIATPFKESIPDLDGPLVPFRQATNGIKGNNGILVLAESPEARMNQTLLIFGDSFFRKLLPYLAWAYRKIIFCRSAFVHEEMLDAVKPDIVLGGAAERYLAGCHPDASRPHFMAYPLLSGRRLIPEQGFAELFNQYFDQASLIGLGHR